MMVSTRIFSWLPLFERVVIYWLFAHTLVLPYLPRTLFPKVSYQKSLSFTKSSAPCRSRGHRDTEKPRGLCVPMILF